MSTANATKGKRAIRSQARRRPPGSNMELPSADERVARGKRARAEAPRSSHAVWEPPSDGTTRSTCWSGRRRPAFPELVPIRHGRMLVSPFTYYRGAALPMASDLATTPELGAARADLRGRTPLQLRSLRLARAPPLLRRQRLRRDRAGPMGVGREAPGGQSGDRRSRQRVPGEGAKEHRASGGALLPRGDARVRANVDARGLVRAPRHGRVAAAVSVEP